MIKQAELSDRIKKGELAIAQAKAEGRNVTEWERYLEALKLEAGRLFPGDTENKGISCDLEEGEIVAVKIESTVLGADIWLAFRDDFDPQDGKAIFYADELAILKSKTPEQLRTIHKTKLTWPPGSRARK